MRVRPSHMIEAVSEYDGHTWQSLDTVRHFKYVFTSPEIGTGPDTGENSRITNECLINSKDATGKPAKYKNFSSSG